MTVCVCYLSSHDYPFLMEGESHGILLLYLHIARILPLNYSHLWPHNYTNELN